MQTIAIDSNFTLAMRLLSNAYWNQGLNDDAKDGFLNIKKKDMMNGPGKLDFV